MITFRTWPVAIFASGLCLFLWLIWNSGSLTTSISGDFTNSSGDTQTLSPPQFPPHPAGCFTSPNGTILGEVDVCANIPTQRLSDVQITIKTGIAERDHLAAQLATFTSCISNLLIVSDAPDRIVDHNVTDILATLPASYHSDTDWPTYLSQREQAQQKQYEQIKKSPAGWRLDRLKFLPMIDHAYDKNPDAKWYVFIETDIYYFWDSLFRILDRLDSNEYHYLGSPTPGANNLWFAYGGAGFVLSRKLIRDLTQNGEQRLAVKYEQLARDDSAGDAALGYAIHQELGVKLGHLYPSFPGEPLEDVRIRDDKLCKPLVGFHRTSAEQMSSLWGWERCRWYSDGVITYATFLDYGLTPLLRANVSMTVHWNNAADEGWKVPEGKESALACAETCGKGQTCLQWMYRDGICFHADYLQLGRAITEEVVSGWDVKKLAARGLHLDQRRAPICGKVEWLTPRMGKPFD